jgi:formate--tetrahydrofolate ligase
VATAKALKHHGGDPAGGIEAIERGAVNLDAHLKCVHEFGVEAVVAVNRFPGDTAEEVDTVRRLALELGAHAAEPNEAPGRGGDGAAALAEAVVDAASRPTRFEFLYTLDDALPTKIEAIATRLYGAAGVELLPTARNRLAELERLGADGLPVCMAKTQMSLSHDPALIGAPTGFTLPVRDLRPYTGAGWVVALCGDVMTMPGLSTTPAALEIDLDQQGHTVGLF